MAGPSSQDDGFSSRFAPVVLTMPKVLVGRLALRRNSVKSDGIRASFHDARDQGHQPRPLIAYRSAARSNRLRTLMPPLSRYSGRNSGPSTMYW